MRALVIAEASDTTSDKDIQALDYYRGNFLPVRSLVDRLAQYAHTDTYIITDRYGLLHGTDSIKHVATEPYNQAITDATDTLLDHLTDTDIIVILTTSDTFRAVVADNWNAIVKNAKPESVYCLSSGRTALNECSLDKLRGKVHTLHTYQRVGVAPIDNDTKSMLLDTIESI
jgi:hypothetical protein